jgi:hypothetical protein
MKIGTEFTSFVIVGQWNSAIFTPEWVSKYLIPNPINIEVLINNTNGSFRFSTDEFRFFIIDGRFHFVILKHNDEVYSKIGDLAYKIVDYLPHTPVSAFGINYLFESENTDNTDTLNTLFSFSDDLTISNQGYQYTNSIIRRTLLKDNNILNLLITKKNSNYSIDLNFHFDIKSIVDFKDKFQPDDLLKFKNESKTLLNSIYGLNIN